MSDSRIPQVFADITGPRFARPRSRTVRRVLEAAEASRAQLVKPGGRPAAPGSVLPPWRASSGFA